MLNLHKMTMRRGIVGLAQPAAVLRALFKPSEVVGSWVARECAVEVIPHPDRICCVVEPGLFEVCD